MLPFHAAVFSVFLREEKIHISHICKAADWKKKFTLILPIKFWKAFSVDIDFLYLFQNKNLDQTEDTLFGSLFENNWNGKYPEWLRLVSLFFKLTSQHWHPIIPVLLRFFLGMARERRLIYQAAGVHVLIKQLVTLSLSLIKPQVLPVVYSRPMCCSLLGFVYEENQIPSISGVRVRDVQHDIF